MSDPKSLMVNDVKYVREDCLKTKAPALDGLERSIIRSYGAGVFIGYVKERVAELNGINITLLEAKRIHYWSGACSLTQLALDGTKDGGSCRITEPVESQFIANVIEIIPVTEKASRSIDSVEIWKK